MVFFFLLFLLIESSNFVRFVHNWNWILKRGPLLPNVHRHSTKALTMSAVWATTPWNETTTMLLPIYQLNLGDDSDDDDGDDDECRQQPSDGYLLTWLARHLYQTLRYQVLQL